MSAPRYHLVARCPCCERPLWPRTITKLLGLVPYAQRHTEIAFVAISGRGRGRGWRGAGVLRTLADVAASAGPMAVEQLRHLANQAFERMWYAGLLTSAHVERVTGTATYPSSTTVPRTLDFGTYSPPQAYGHPPQPDVPPPQPVRQAVQARTIDCKEWKP